LVLSPCFLWSSLSLRSSYVAAHPTSSIFLIAALTSPSPTPSGHGSSSASLRRRDWGWLFGWFIEKKKIDGLNETVRCAGIYTYYAIWWGQNGPIKNVDETFWQNL
jgi:hypothetical protein